MKSRMPKYKSFENNNLKRRIYKIFDTALEIYNKITDVEWELTRKGRCYISLKTNSIEIDGQDEE